MKKGQNTQYEKEYFQSGIGGKVSSTTLQNIVSRWSGSGKVHRDAKNIARKKKKKGGRK